MNIEMMDRLLGTFMSGNTLKNLQMKSLNTLDLNRAKYAVIMILTLKPMKLCLFVIHELLSTHEIYNLGSVLKVETKILKFIQKFKIELIHETTFN